MTHPGRNEIKKALRSGALFKPECCEKCGIQKPRRDIVAHHPRGYEPEHILDIEWLCRRCHAVEHRCGFQRRTKEEMRAQLRGRMTTEQLAANGRKGMAAAQKTMKARYTPSELSALRRAAAIKGNQVRWGSR